MSSSNQKDPTQKTRDDSPTWYPFLSNVTLTITGSEAQHMQQSFLLCVCSMAGWNGCWQFELLIYVDNKDDDDIKKNRNNNNDTDNEGIIEWRTVYRYFKQTFHIGCPVPHHLRFHPITSELSLFLLCLLFIIILIIIINIVITECGRYFPGSWKELLWWNK